MGGRLQTAGLVGALKAAAEPTRLRILVLLAEGELNVKDLTQVLGQSQPRISRHLKLLAEAGLVDRIREGSWVYFHIAETSEAGNLARTLIAAVDPADAVLQRDRARAEAAKRDRESAAQAYFHEHAADWDRIRSLHIDESEVEAAMRACLGEGPFKLLVDLGTGTGRTLDLFSGSYARGLGIDANHAMLALARANLARSGNSGAQVRHGDIYHLALDGGAADAVVMHQVLHFLSEPGSAIAEAARVLAPGGRLLIVDFAPHEHEFLREAHAHERLGFADAQIRKWCEDAGLRPLGATKLDAPGGSSDRLTVVLWLAERSAAGQAAWPIPRQTVKERADG